MKNNPMVIIFVLLFRFIQVKKVETEIIIFHISPPELCPFTLVYFTGISLYMDVFLLKNFPLLFEFFKFTLLGKYTLLIILQTASFIIDINFMIKFIYV